MLVEFDTSVLVAATLEAHEFHTRAWRWLKGIHLGEIEAMLCVHGLAEFYSALTKMPKGLSPTAARVAVSSLTKRFRVILPTLTTYLNATERCAARSLKSGSVFDALHLIEAERSGAEVLVTFNPSDFTRLSKGEKPRIVVPPDPPSVQIRTSVGKRNCRAEARQASIACKLTGRCRTQYTCPRA